MNTDGLVKATPEDEKDIKRITKNILDVLEYEMSFNALTALIEVIAMLMSSRELIKEDKELCIDGIMGQLKLRVDHHIIKGTTLK